MLRLNGVTVRYGNTAAVDSVDLDVKDGERLSILGPSGSGKSTLLRAIAGLEPLSAGSIQWDGRDLADVPVHQRGFGLMFQDYVLFPHLDVAGNVRFGLDAQAVPRAEADQRVADVLGLVGLSGYDRRLSAQLSGGEQQRVALARALAPNPRLLMLDEPLGALDRSLRRSLLDELSDLFAGLRLPIVYVTHDHEEALAIGDRVAVMRAGRLEAVAPPRDLWLRPPTEFVARFLGLNNIIDAQVTAGRASTALGTFDLDTAGAATTAMRDGPFRLLIRPDALRLDPAGPISVRVVSTTFRGDHTLVRATTGDQDSTMTLEFQADQGPVPEVGREVRLAVAPAGLVLLPLT